MVMPRKYFSYEEELKARTQRRRLKNEQMKELIVLELVNKIRTSKESDEQMAKILLQNYRILPKQK